MTYTMNINGVRHETDVPEDMPLLWFLRDELGSTGTRYGCGQGLCGACTILLDGMPVRSCQTTVYDAEGTNIVTLEGNAGVVADALRAAWTEDNVAQCGYCQGGQIMSATALLTENPNPSDMDIDDAMSGNICRCGTYGRIRAAIRKAATRLKA